MALNAQYLQDQETRPNEEDSLNPARFDPKKGADSAQAQQDLRDGEEAGDDAGDNEIAWRGSPTRKKMRTALKRYGAGGGLTSGVMVAFLGMSALLAPASLLINISKIFTNSNDLGDHIFIKTSESYVTSLLKGHTRNCATSKIKCKFGSISDKQLQNYQDRGITVDSEKTILGRNKIRGLTFKDGTKVTTIRQYKNLRYTSPENYALLKRFNVRSYLEPKGALQFVLDKFGLKKSSVIDADHSTNPDDREKNTNKAADDHTKAKTGDTLDARVAANTKALEEDPKYANRASAGDETKQPYKRLAGAAIGVLSAGDAAVLAGCSAYNVIHVTSAAMQLYWHRELLTFMFPFIQAGSQILDQGNIDQSLVEYLGNRLTAADTTETAVSPDMVGKTAMDAPAMGAALSGDYESIPDSEQPYNGWAPQAAMFGSGAVTAVTQLFGKKNIKTACKAAAIAGWAALGLDGISCIGPQFLVCSAKLVLTSAAGSVAMTIAEHELAKEAVKPAIKMIATANLTSALFGMRLGQAIGSAMGIAGGYKDRASALPVAGTQGQALSYYQSVEQDYNADQIAEAKSQAKRNQFDFTNQYSFAGKLTQAFNPYTPNDGTVFGYIANAFAASFSGLGSLGYVTKATKDGIFMPVQVYSRQDALVPTFQNCQDPAKQAIGITCMGESGKPVTYMSPEIEQCINNETSSDDDNPQDLCFDKAVDYLQGKGYLESDGSGVPVNWSQYNPDDYNKDYKFDNGTVDPLLMYMENCTRDRKYDIGYSDLPFDADNMDWHLGARCGANDDTGTHHPEYEEDLGWIWYYVHECTVVYAQEEDTNYCWSDDTPAATNTGDWVLPTQPPCLQGWKGPAHHGIDISPPEGTDIVAPTSMRIVWAGMKNDGYGYSVVAQATDGSNNMFRFGHMNGQPSVSVGQTVNKSTVIGHVGHTGQATGPHLHFEIFAPGTPDNAYASGGAHDLNPLTVLKQHGVHLDCSDGEEP